MSRAFQKLVIFPAESNRTLQLDTGEVPVFLRSSWTWAPEPQSPTIFVDADSTLAVGGEFGDGDGVGFGHAHPVPQPPGMVAFFGAGGTVARRAGL